MYGVEGEVVVLADPPEDLQAAVCKTERIQSYLKCWLRKPQVHE